MNLRLLLFLAFSTPLFLCWAAYHTFIKKDFAAIKSDFTVGALYLVLASLVFYALSLV